MEITERNMKKVEKWFDSKSDYDKVDMWDEYCLEHKKNASVYFMRDFNQVFKHKKKLDLLRMARLGKFDERENLFTVYNGELLSFESFRDFKDSIGIDGLLEEILEEDEDGEIEQIREDNREESEYLEKANQREFEDLCYLYNHDRV